jgi:predicted ATPase/class 3 adenylate cyclase
MTTGIMTFLFTDIEGSTALLTRLGDAAYSEVLEDHHRIIRSSLQAFGGAEHGTQGDSFFAVFVSPSACVSAALQMQRDLCAHDWPAGEELRVRMGIHTGEASEASTGMVGYEVHRAARIAAVGYGGQVLISSSTMALVGDSLPLGASVLDLGSHRLKDLGRPEVIFQLIAEDLDEQFPPLRSLDSPALLSNLPLELTSFVGRDHELAQVRALVEESRLVTLTGTGGAGKTRLALQVGAELLAGSSDGVWLVELAAVGDPEAVPGAVASSLGVEHEPGREVSQTLVRALASQRRLVILDNCEHLIGACAKLTEAIVRGCPNIHLMVTSREPLGIDGEHVFRVPSLSLPPPDADTRSDMIGSGAVSLFVERAAAHGSGLVLSDANARTVAAICQRLDGMPLAIELAASRLRSMALSQLHDRLDQRFRLLTGGSRNALPRQQTLRALVDWSYDLLTQIEQTLFRRLSVFAGGFELEAAEAACAFGKLEDFDVIDLLGSLVDKSLVVLEAPADSARYRLLGTLRQYAAEKLVDTDGGYDAAKTRHAHATYYLAYAEAAAPHLSGPSQNVWLDRLEEEYPNLRVAAKQFVDAGEAAQAVCLFGATRRYWQNYPHDEVVALLGRALEVTGGEAPPGDRAAALACRAHMLADLVDQTNCVREAIDAARAAGDRRLEAEALGLLCMVAYFRGEVAEGLESGARAVAIARELGDLVLLGSTLTEYASAVQVNDMAAGEALFREGLEVAERSGDVSTALALHSNYGCCLLQEGRMAEARHQLEMALALARTPRGVSILLSNLGFVQLQEGDIGGAASNFTEALRLARLSGYLRSLSYVTLGLALCASRSDDIDRAVVLHGGAAALLEALGATGWERPEEDYRERDISKLRTSAGSKFDHFYEAGFAMSHDEIVDLALAGNR